ncbi:formylmethanofuran dehydrogenase subunit C [Marinimicrococcus flavescens]|uniref:Formylmethanofuran dehydrogenase subunit C n=1 Tax=Marinimicrococcus flavescens TaxID=3031815 RepID=A0AAP3XRW5_9PROT|nr:formylmethanofuran dehydrogenase subunit C [Marinimicrococcus flavescens]
MGGLTLTLRERVRLPVDMAPVLPELLAGLSAQEIGKLELQCGNRRVPLGELFEVAAGDPQRLVIRDTCPALERIGAGMKGGAIAVEGDAGALPGLGMKGGSIEVAGAAGAFAGSEMSGGVIRVAGDAAGFVGAAQAGGRFGMTGGAVLVGGDLGDRAGDRMRRGLVLGGSAGLHAGSRMIGGTILVRGTCSTLPGVGMKRGTLILGGTAAAPATFADNGVHELGWLALLERHLAGLGLRGMFPSRRVRRLTGDLAAGGKGEILVAA